MSNEDYILNFISPKEPVTAEVANRVSRALASRIARLDDRIRSLAYSKSENGMYLNDRIVSDNVDVGDFVYYDKAHNLLDRAIAGMQLSEIGNYERLGATLALGVVTQKIGKRAKVLIDGAQLFDADVLKNMVEAGQEYEPGALYYLSASEPGKITKYEPAMPIQLGVAGEDYFILNTVFSSTRGVEKSAKCAYTFRPVGSQILDNGVRKVVGFDGLEFVSSYWRSLLSSSDTPAHREKGWIAADFQAYQEIETPIWCMVFVAATTGSITVRTAETLSGLTPTDGLGTAIRSQAQVTSAFPTIDTFVSIDEVTNLDALSGNANTVRTVDIRNRQLTTVGRLQFKFTSPDVSNDRLTIFKIPNSFDGWRYLEEDPDTVVYDYSEALFNGGSPQKPQQGAAYYYYNKRGNTTIASNWPSEPLEKVAMLRNGVDQQVATMLNNGVNSTFSNSRATLGVAAPTFFWIPSTAPWDSSHALFTTSGSDATDLDARLVFLGSTFYWWEDVQANSDNQNYGTFYSNKVLNLFKEVGVSTILAQEPLSLRKADTGTEIGSGVPASGNLEIYLKNNTEVYQKLTNVDLTINRGPTNPIVAFVNSSGSPVMLSSCTFHVKTQATSVEEDDAAYTQSDDDTALVSLNLSAATSDFPLLEDTRLGVKYSNSYRNFVFDAPTFVIGNGQTLYLKIKEGAHGQIQSQPADIIFRGFKL